MRIHGKIVPEPTLENVSDWPFEMVGFVDVVDCGELDENGVPDWGVANFWFNNQTSGPGFSFSREILELASIGVFEFSETEKFRVWLVPDPEKSVPVGGVNGISNVQVYRAVRIERA